MHDHIEPHLWEQIFETLKTFKGLHRKNEKKLRRFVEGVWYVARSGCQWRMLPRFYGKFRSVHARFMSWAKSGIWARLFESVQENPDKESLMIDATIVRAHALAESVK